MLHILEMANQRSLDDISLDGDNLGVILSLPFAHDAMPRVHSELVNPFKHVLERWITALLYGH
jgi:hypothetical protein